MPTYTYKCKDENCGRTITLLRPIVDRDNPEVGCLCGGPVERVPDAPDFTVKGGTPRFHK